MKKTLTGIFLVAAGLLALYAVLFFHRPKSEEEEGALSARVLSFTGDTLVCAIAVDDHPLSLSAGGFAASLNMELIRHCAREDSFEFRFVRPVNGIPDSLEAGRYDLLVAYADSLEGDRFRMVPAAGEGVVWALAPHHSDKADSLERWLVRYRNTEAYVADSVRFRCVFTPRKAFDKGWRLSRISPYDQAVRTAALELGWDWRLLSALIFTESKFSSTALSHRGAFGLMQIVPEDGDCDPLLDPYVSIERGTAHLKRIQRFFRSQGVDSLDALRHITVAAYNAGEGRMTDCMNLAEALGYRRDSWEDLAAVIPLMATHADSIDAIAMGRFRGKETLAYVDSVFTNYYLYQQIVP